MGGRSNRRRRMDREAMASAGLRPLQVILLGRTGKRRHGGIGRSAAMIVAALERLGNVVRLRNVLEPLDDIPSDTDLIWHYGDWELVAEQAAAAAEAGVPMLVNSTYDGTPERRRWMRAKLEEWGDHVRMVVFTGQARDDVRLSSFRDRLVMLPKTIRAAPPGRLFAAREGVCVGEIEKLARARLVRGIDVAESIAALRASLPGVPLYAYNQYGTSTTPIPEGVLVVSPGEEMLDWLGTLRLVVSLVAHETFAMVPAEAQGAGTPVIFRPMGQSLTEHLGATAVAVETPSELALAAKVLYNDELRWTRYSAAGLCNVDARGLATAGVAIDMALRKLVLA